MKILIVTQYFWPEFWLINKLSQKLTGLGHKITVVTGKPNYPEGIIYDGYTYTGIVKEIYGDVEVLRIPLRPRGKGIFGLIRNYMSFVFSGIQHMPSMLKGREFDAIMVFAPSPITSAIPAIWLKRKLGSHLVIWVQDLWPQSLSATGHINNRFLLYLAGLLVRWIYKKSDTILAQSHAFEDEIQKVASKDKIIYYPNSIDNKSDASDSYELPEHIKSSFDSGFNLVFSGNIGTAQAIPTLLQAAKGLQDTDCRFIFIGNGSLVGWAKEEVAKFKLPNVIFLGRLDNSMMPSIYQCADALLVSLSSREIFSYTIPGKLQAYLAAGKPIVASLNGEAADIVREANAGVVCASEDSQALDTAIRSLMKQPQSKRDEMGLSGLRYFKKNFDMDVLVVRLVDILNKRIEALK